VSFDILDRSLFTEGPITGLLLVSFDLMRSLLTCSAYLWHTSIPAGQLQCVIVCRCVLPSFAVSCCVLPCFAVCCRVFPCGAVTGV